MRNPSGGEDIGVRVAVDHGVGGGSVLVDVTEGVRLGSVVAVVVGTGVATPQAGKLTVMAKIRNKLDNQCDVFIACPN